tara:strand:- start:439 stop:630 length:192 start_codon:yes stop_codon:yes gene_type:complete
MSVDEFCIRTDTLPQDWKAGLKSTDKVTIHADGTVIFNTAKEDYQPIYEPQVRERIKRVYLAI